MASGARLRLAQKLSLPPRSTTRRVGWQLQAALDHLKLSDPRCGGLAPAAARGASAVAAGRA